MRSFKFHKRSGSFKTCIFGSKRPGVESQRQGSAAEARLGRWLTPALILACLLPAMGCATHNRDAYWQKHFVNEGYEKYVVGELKPSAQNSWAYCYYHVGSAKCPATQRTYRNRVINGYILVADTAFLKFEGGYNQNIAYFEIGSDMVNLGLTAAASVAPPAALLGAAATATQGVQHSIEKNGLDSQTRFVIINRMQAIREQQRALIMQRELLPVSCARRHHRPGQKISDVCYPLEDAMVDVQKYFNLGTITRALSNIEDQTQEMKSKGTQRPSGSP